MTRRLPNNRLCMSLWRTNRNVGSGSSCETLERQRLRHFARCEEVRFGIHEAGRAHVYVVTATRGDERSRSGLVRMGAIMLRSAAGRTRGITWVVVWDRCSGQHVADEQGRQLFSAIGSVCDEPPDRRLLVRHVCHNASVPNAGSRGGVVRNDGVTVALRDWTARGRAFSWLYFADDDNHYHPLLFDKLHAHRSAPGRQIAVWAAQTCSDNNRPASKSRSKFNCTADGQGLMDWGHYTGRLFELDVSMRVCVRACGRVCWWWRSWRCIHTCMCACAGTVLALVRMRVRECVHVRACACMCVTMFMCGLLTNGVNLPVCMYSYYQVYIVACKCLLHCHRATCYLSAE